MPRTKGYKVMKDGTMIIHPDIGSDQAIGDSIQIPQTDTAEGAGFGDTIQDKDRAFAAEREPVAHFLTYGVAADITEKWFLINDPDTEEADPALDRTVQSALSKLEFKKHLTEALESERIYGKSLLVGAFSDAKDVDQLKKPLKKGSELLQLAVYPSTKDNQKIKEFWVDSKDQEKNSRRFGEPIIYKLDRGSGNYLLVHYTRVCEVKTRSSATSVLDPVWDDLTCGRNIRWGASQWMYRTGGGFATIGFPAGTTAEQLEAYHNTNAFSNLMSRTAIFIAQNSTNENDGMTFDFKGAAGHALDPIPFFQTNVEQIAIATGIPQAKLVGAQAGAVTGSEVNMQDYFKVISREQSKIESVVKWVIDHLAESGQLSIVKAAVDKKSDNYEVNLLKRMLRKVIRRDYRHKTAENYVIEWNSAFELSELSEAQVEQLHTQANQGKLDYMTIDEVRAEENLDPLPNGEGASLKKSSFGLFGEEQGKEGNEELAESDKFLVVDLKRKRKQNAKSSSSSSDSKGQEVDS
ncbi:MAG: DUF1073 domain-containing protein [Candidatus Bathyarchaeota archaeon]|nr:DUF1073 domain-containing protein [Candidatus Bathyarchaeota archaeon]